MSGLHDESNDDSGDEAGEFVRCGHWNLRNPAIWLTLIEAGKFN
jgi:hypothetical protein